MIYLKLNAVNKVVSIYSEKTSESGCDIACIVMRANHKTCTTDIVYKCAVQNNRLDESGKCNRTSTVIYF